MKSWSLLRPLSTLTQKGILPNILYRRGWHGLTAEIILIQIDLSIYDPETGAKIWPNKNTPASDIVVSSKNGDGRIKFPVSTSTIKEWKPGYHYIYNVVINGHHDIGEIEFGEPTVDTFVEVNTDYDFPASE
jgi:hypothetical protein